MYYIPWTLPSPHSKRHLDWFSRFCEAHDRDKATDRPRYSVCNNERNYSSVMRPNNNDDLVVISSISNIISFQCRTVTEFDTYSRGMGWVKITLKYSGLGSIQHPVCPVGL